MSLVDAPSLAATVRGFLESRQCLGEPIAIDGLATPELAVGAGLGGGLGRGSSPLIAGLRRRALASPAPHSRGTPFRGAPHWQRACRRSRRSAGGCRRSAPGCPVLRAPTPLRSAPCPARAIALLGPAARAPDW